MYVNCYETQVRVTFLSFSVLLRPVGVSGKDAASKVADIIKECDKNGDGQISFEEFLAAMQSKDKNFGRKKGDAPSSTPTPMKK